LPLLVRSTAALELALKIDRDWEGKEVVALFRNGFSNASFIFFTLTCPNPGRFCRRSVGVLAISAKLYHKIEYPNVIMSNPGMTKTYVPQATS
jgi:hypothetical protein